MYVIAAVYQHTRKYTMMICIAFEEKKSQAYLTAITFGKEKDYFHQRFPRMSPLNTTVELIGIPNYSRS